MRSDGFTDAEIEAAALSIIASLDPAVQRAKRASLSVLEWQRLPWRKRLWEWVRPW